MAKLAEQKTNITYHKNVTEDCKPAIKEILESSGFFYDYEVEVALQLVDERLEDPEIGYYFIFAECDGKIIGYTCFGDIPCTVASFDLYWIAVHNDYRGHGIGKILMKKTEDAIEEMGGRGIYVETSGRDLYKPTREFYVRCGYKEEAVLKDYYSPGDDKVITVKKFAVKK